ncbi:MAG: ATP-binding cassette domain-containing protein, partial [Clostridia bacterium]
MKRLQADHLLVQVGARTLFHIERLDIWDGERIGLVGENGAGKSTLLSVLYGDRLPDAGTVTRMCACAMVRQFGEAEEGFDPAIAARLHEVDAHVGMSGGEETRRKLSHALAMQAPLLLLDEPTTHLDFEGLRAVQETLQAYAGAMVLVSHDRELLDALCTRIWALEDGGLQV